MIKGHGRDNTWDLGLVCCQVIGKEERGVELPAQKNFLEGKED